MIMTNSHGQSLSKQLLFVQQIKWMLSLSHIIASILLDNTAHAFPIYKTSATLID